MKLSITTSIIIINILFISQITHQQSPDHIPAKSQPTDKNTQATKPAANNQQILQKNVINGSQTQQIKQTIQTKNKNEEPPIINNNDQRKVIDNAKKQQQQQQHKLNLKDLLHKAKQIGILSNQTQGEKIIKIVEDMNPEQINGYMKSLVKVIADAQQKYKKIYEQEDKKYQEQLAHYQVDEPIQYQQNEDDKIVTKTQEYRLKQATKSQQYFKQNKQDSQGSSHSYSFTLETQSIADFKIDVPIQQKIVISVHLYINYQGVYQFQSSAEDSQALETLVYQNRHKLVYQNKYYFQDVISFNANANSSYLIRFNNPGKHRFIFMTIKYVLESHHFDFALSSQHGINYHSRIDSMSSKFQQKLQQSRNRMILQDKNQEALLYKLAHYYYFSIVQIIFIGILCIIQVECIRKMINNSTVI